MPSKSSRLLSEPLAQFALIGFVLFAASRILSPEEIDPNLIRVDASVHRDLAEIFSNERGRNPTKEEMDALVDRYVMNEALFREARGLQLDHGDEMVRERLMQRMRLMLYNGVNVENPPEDVLRAWFEENAESYSIPARISVNIIGLDTDEGSALETAEEVNQRLAAGEILSPTDYNIVRMKKRPRDNLVRLFGEDFVSELEAAPTDTFAPIASPRGFQLVQLQEVDPAVERSFEEVKNQARADWRQEQVQIEARAALEAMLARYPVDKEQYDPEHLSTEPQAATIRPVSD